MQEKLDKNADYDNTTKLKEFHQRQKIFEDIIIERVKTL
jgi:hypothetical protein